MPRRLRYSRTGSIRGWLRWSDSLVLGLLVAGWGSGVGMLRLRRGLRFALAAASLCMTNRRGSGWGRDASTAPRPSLCSGCGFAQHDKCYELSCARHEQGGSVMLSGVPATRMRRWCGVEASLPGHGTRIAFALRDRSLASPSFPDHGIRFRQVAGGPRHMDLATCSPSFREFPDKLL
jgi:hypothetical protein